MRMLTALLGALAAFLPRAASAHEVYVLTPAEIHADIATPSWSELALAMHDVSQVALWGFIAALLVFIVFFVSLSRALETRLDPLLARARRYAAPVARVTIGLSFLAAAYYQAIFGPELPLAADYGAASWLITALLVVLGGAIVLGIYTRLAALAALALFAIAVYLHGSYMLTYANYLGEILVLLILGAHHGIGPRIGEQPLAKRFAPYSFVLLRICFGMSLLYASLYAKIIHNNLALSVASMPLAGHMLSVAAALGFEPHFLVLGAAIVEIVIALFFILGIEIRFTALFLLFWLSLSLWWFGEVVWPHVILIGIPIGFILWGYDRYSLEGAFFKQGGREPVL